MFIPKDSDDRFQGFNAAQSAKRPWASNSSFGKAVTSLKKKRVALPMTLYGDVGGTEPCIQLKTETISETLREELLAIKVEEKAWSILSQNILYVKQHAGYLLKHDQRLEAVTKPLTAYGQIILFESLGEAGMAPSDSSISLNLNVIAKLAKHALVQKELQPDQWLGLACTIFLFHEISHCSQRLICHEDVQAMKSVNLPSGRLIMAELDLLSDYLAAHALSIVSTLKANDGVFNTKIYYEHLYIIWCQVCKGMLEVFSLKGERKKNKFRRAFGYLLMSNLISDTYLRSCPLGLSEELFPDWNKSLDRLSIRSGRQPWINGACVNPILMRQALNALSRGDLESASSGIRKIWQSLPNNISY
ncbi:MAG: hypothetical protein KME27_09825 [Lyngbya sp. HA4199-MV5]|jgi:hypothetical protein|nr:hypothetical protein [Lyngbya sp. HA4199-MV5]